MSALMMCCVEGNSEMARLLLDSHSNPDLQQSVRILEKVANRYIIVCLFLQDTGCTALMFACMRGHLDTVMLLMEYGADSQIRNIVSARSTPVCTIMQCIVIIFNVVNIGSILLIHISISVAYYKQTDTRLCE